MSAILITGASGFIGQALAPTLAESHDVVCMSRKDPKLDLPWVRGEFGSFEDLCQLDSETIKAVVHLGAVTGGSSERDGMLVNVEGSRCLMRYLIDRGCNKFVMASSIAAVGFQSIRFRPLQVPIPDEHPCLDRDGYGFSKFLMEELTKYYQRQHEDIDVINLRIASILADDKLPSPSGIVPLREWGLGGITIMALSDIVRAMVLAVEAPAKPGVRILNATSPKAWVGDPTAEILRHWWGNDVDLSYFTKPGQVYDSVFDVYRIQEELGFTAEHLPDV